jgi:hypothetical protein
MRSPIAAAISPSLPLWLMKMSAIHPPSRSGQLALSSEDGRIDHHNIKQNEAAWYYLLNV